MLLNVQYCSVMFLNSFFFIYSYGSLATKNLVLSRINIQYFILLSLIFLYGKKNICLAILKIYLIFLDIYYESISKKKKYCTV